MSAAEKKVILIMDKQEEKHDQPWTSYHIETSKRLDVIFEKLKSTGLYHDSRIEHLPQREATKQELLSVHTERYVNDVKATESMTVDQQETFCSKYEDIFVNSATWKRAKLAAGSAIDLVTSVAISKMPGIAFVRPPGHHSMPDGGCGFCIFNNVAIAAKEAIRTGFAKRVMIVDYDVHAANGTQECVETMGKNVRLVSIHRYENGNFWPNMPQTGIYHKYKNTINLPLNTTSLTDSDYLALFTHIIIPLVHSYKPDLIIVSSGFDASLGDPEGYMNVTPAGFATMVRMLMNTGCPVAAILEGGYFLEALAADSEWVLRALLGEQIPKIHVEKINPSIADTISKTLSRYEKTSSFFRKVQELRNILGQSVLENSEGLTDYKGERIVHPPYETRNIYTPFSPEKVDGFKQQLESILKSYQTKEDPLDINQYFISSTSDIDIDDNYIGIRGDKILVGEGKATKLFAELLFIASFDPLFTVNRHADVAKVNFDSITFDNGLVDLKNIPKFQNLPILQL